jgi:hypothetical protein
MTGGAAVKPGPRDLPVFSVEARTGERPVRCCPACRAVWPIDWEYCARCAVWLPGNESVDRRTRLVPVVMDTRRAEVTAGAPPTASDTLVLACEVRSPVARPRPEALRRGEALLHAVTAIIGAHGGAPRIALGAGVLGLWRRDDAAVVARSAAAIVRAARERDRTGEPDRRLSLGLGIAPGGPAASPVESATSALRLASLATADLPLVSEAVYAATRDWFDYRGVGPAVPHSDPLPGLVFELLGLKAERSGSWPVGPERAPLVGRDDAFRVLDDWRGRAEAGEAVVLHVVGEPGLGKSKLLREWLAASERAGSLEGWQRMEACGVPYGDFPVRTWARLVAPLWPRPPVEPPSPDEACSRLRATARPALLVVDDLHWVDVAAPGRLAQLLAGLADRPVLAVLAYRPSFQSLAPTEPAGLQHRLRLGGLRREALRVVIETLAEASRLELAPALREEIVSRAEGNPLYVEEAMALLADLGVAGPERMRPLPATLPELLVRRVEWTVAHRLPELERRYRDGLLAEGAGFASRAERRAVLADLEALEERLAAWLDRLEAIEATASPLVATLLSGLRALDGRLALLSLLVGRQRPHRHRLAQGLARLGAGAAS